MTWPKNMQARNMPKWLVQTLHDRKLDAPMSSYTCLGSQHVSYASNCYALAVSSMCDEEKPITYNET